MSWNKRNNCNNTHGATIKIHEGNSCCQMCEVMVQQAHKLLCCQVVCRLQQS